MNDNRTNLKQETPLKVGRYINEKAVRNRSKGKTLAIVVVVTLLLVSLALSITHGKDNLPNDILPEAVDGSINGHDYVDLGLSVKWATCNVGASSPTDCGNYYSWGEVSTKEAYIDTNCTTYEKDLGDISGNSSYDAARANWGGSWRLPTKVEFQELIDNCDSEWATTQTGELCGFKITSRKNGKSIVLPTNGYHTWLLHGINDSGGYWSSTPNQTDGAFCLSFSDLVICWEFREVGLGVRPVTE